MSSFIYNGQEYTAIHEKAINKCDGCYFYVPIDEIEGNCGISDNEVESFPTVCGSEPVIYIKSLKNVLKNL